MRRREFIARLMGATAWPAIARGQTTERLRQIAVLVGPARTDVEADRRLFAFRQGLRALALLWQILTGGRRSGIPKSVFQ